MHNLVFFFFFIFFCCSMVCLGEEKEFFPWKNADKITDYQVWGKVVPIPEKERMERGDVEIIEGGFTRNLNWPGDENGELEISVRFRNVPAGGKPGLEVSLTDGVGFVAQSRGVLFREGKDLRCMARLPVAPDLKGISIWCHGVEGAAVGVDQYTITLREMPVKSQIPGVPEITGIDVSIPFMAQLRFLNYLDNSRGAVIERAEGNGEFKKIAEILPGYHTFSDTAIQPGKNYRYRVRNRSHGGESAWSKVVAVTIPDWKRSPGNTVYYIDSRNGDDANSGTELKAAWKSIDRVNHTVFSPGDKLYFRRGSRWNIPLELHGSGSAEKKICLMAYGEGELPQIVVANTPFALRLKNQSNWDISELELTNRQSIPGNIRQITYGSIKINSDDPCFAPYARKYHQTGVTIELENYGVAENIHIHHLSIHDVEGTQEAKENGGILVKIDGQRKASRFHNLLIEHNTIRRVCRSGIVFKVWPHADRKNWFPSTKVCISGNRLSDIGGDGIVPWACDGVQVTGNEVYRAAATGREANVAIWPWSCDNAVLIGNIAAYTAKLPGNGDGQGFDVDTNNFNTRVENNLSFHNGGGFILICGEKDTPNHRAMICNNVSIADGMAVFTLWNNVHDINIFKNTILVPDNARSVFLIANWGKGEADPIQMKKISFHDNLVVADTPLTLRGMQKAWQIYNNVYWGTYAAGIAEFGTGNVVADPKFRGNIDLVADIPTQLDKLISTGTRAGADICRLYEIRAGEGRGQ
ncbi:right-handed parallel beta-helix repeat-containing protein [uncultured Victivallis sp.]|nr:right-handed parallel beta-helix repeat-containing protein [uncultured Victivallis sp.]